MKAYIGPYRNWIGPYQIADALCFWYPKKVDEYGMKRRAAWVYKFGDFLAHGFHKETPEQRRRLFSGRQERPITWLYKLCNWIDAKRPKRTVWIKTDRYDHWNASHTMSLIILPILRDLREHKHGSGLIADEDVPEGLGLRSTEAPPKENEWGTDENLHKRYAWVLDEMIWAHEQVICDDWEEQYSTGECDFILEDLEDGQGSKIEQGPNHTHKTDWDAVKRHQDRIDNGLRLFGKYYQTLWD